MVYEESVKIEKQMKSSKPKRKPKRRPTKEEDELDIKVRVAAAEYQYLSEKASKESD
jgi:hypothetical protein